MQHGTLEHGVKVRKLALATMFHAPCSMLNVQCSLLHAPCSMFHDHTVRTANEDLQKSSDVFCSIYNSVSQNVLAFKF
jgi:hypothetical protein